MEYNCSVCKVGFSKQKGLKEHFKSDFHGYNLKRKMVGLSAISKPKYDKKQIEQQQLDLQKIKQKYDCQICNKKFQTENTLNNHLESNRHRANEQKQKVIDDYNEKQKKQIDYSKYEVTCLFCGEQTVDMEMNVRHMSRHGFFIPEEEKMVDKQGLLKHLNHKIYQDLECLGCEARFSNFISLQQHMMNKQHVFIECSHELSKFYDLSMDFKALEQYCLKMSQQKQIEQGSISDIDRISSDWEVVRDKEMDEEWEYILDKGDKNDIDNYQIMKAELQDNHEVKLPNGKILGNRVFNRYYKQYFRNKKTNTSITTDCSTLSDLSEETVVYQQQPRFTQQKRQLKLGLRKNKQLYLRHNYRRQYQV